MTKVKSWNQVLAVGFAATVFSFGAAGSVSAECIDAETMMTEGIAYECEQGIKTVNDKSDLRMSTEALMAEGIAFKDSIIATTTKVINCDHKSVLVASENCHCEGITLTSSRESNEDSRQNLASL